MFSNDFVVLVIIVTSIMCCTPSKKVKGAVNRALEARAFERLLYTHGEEKVLLQQNLGCEFLYRLVNQPMT